ncbi:MAG: hypothetical protein Q9M36_12750 [Sulfurovum sp.]|nr:hypothetical protein [Sulfurovum sp.]
MLVIIVYGVFTLIKAYEFISEPQKMAAMLDKMHSEGIEEDNATLTGKFNGMKCAVGKCG